MSGNRLDFHERLNHNKVYLTDDELQCLREALIVWTDNFSVEYCGVDTEVVECKRLFTKLGGTDKIRRSIAP